MKTPRRILFVDDSPFECWLWKRLLERRYGAAVVVDALDNPEAAIARLGPDLDVLIVDWEMPGYDGGEVAAAAEERGVDRGRIVFLSGHSPEVVAARLAGSRRLAIVSKDDPAGRAELLAVLDRIVDGPTDTAGGTLASVGAPSAFA